MSLTNLVVAWAILTSSVVSGFGGYIGGLANMQRQAIEQGCAIYHPTTGQFTWEKRN
jgi:hypothetical protein